MRLINADKLEYTCNADECGMLTGCNHCQYHIITEDEIDKAPTIKAVPIEILEKIKAEIVEHAYPIVHSTNSHELGMTLYGIMQVIDRKISEVQNESID